MLRQVAARVSRPAVLVPSDDVSALAVSALGEELASGFLLPLDDGLRAGLAALPDGSPEVGRDFEWSVPGLFMAGLITASASAFGPTMRFVQGAISRRARWCAAYGDGCGDGCARVRVRVRAVGGSRRPGRAVGGDRTWSSAPGSDVGPRTGRPAPGGPAAYRAALLRPRGARTGSGCRARERERHPERGVTGGTGPGCAGTAGRRPSSGRH